MSTINITNLDFLQIRESFNDYLSAQTEFLDYNLAGSGLSIILDVLASNDVYLAYYLHMVANEAFLDTAVIRKNVVSRAKAIGYFPYSKKSSRAFVTIELFPTGSPANVVIPAGTKFSSIVDHVTYTYQTYQTYVVTPDEDDKYIVEDVELIEGDQLTHKFTIDNVKYLPGSRLLLPNSGIDTSLITVTVQKSVSDTTFEVWKLAGDVNDLKATDKIYFVQEADDLQYEIYFGDNIIGKSPDVGNIVRVQYTISNGSLPNGALKFQPFTSVGGITNTRITTTSVAAGGVDEQPIESIRLIAPLNYQAQNRAVTKTDYEVLIKKDYPAIDSVRVWGGEENDPPMYGKVFLSLKPISELVLSTETKNYLINQVIRKRNMISTEVVIVDPNYIFINVSSVVKFKSSITNDTPGTIKSNVINAITNFGEDNLNKFDGYFRFSQLSRAIDSSHDAIQNNLSSVTLTCEIPINFELEEKHIVTFSNAIVPGSLSSTGFSYIGYTCYFQDDENGNVQIYRLINGIRTIVKTVIGTIDYASGKISLDKTFIPATVSGDEFIDVTVTPANLDILSVRNEIVLFDENKISVTLIDESIE